MAKQGSPVKVIAYDAVTKEPLMIFNSYAEVSRCGFIPGNVMKATKGDSAHHRGIIWRRVNE